ncbi:hypothetical protein PAND9192_03641 [Photobacterium andalusiense]|uniref:Uncharacterized protein n=1 Tax=Photobacterium andalusiense TaxID=2204296 RepID=A0A1Y6MT42_9GAMM|nr:hypothetical protein PAND9192_03641 [Photobacterium andalusiense]
MEYKKASNSDTARGFYLFNDNSVLKLITVITVY